MNDQTPKLFRFDQIEFSAANLLQIVALLVAVGAAWFAFKSNLGQVAAEMRLVNDTVKRIETQFAAFQVWRSEVEREMLVSKIRSNDRWSAHMEREGWLLLQDKNPNINSLTLDEIEKIQSRGLKLLQP